MRTARTVDPLVQQIRANREALGWTRADLADRAGIRTSTVTALEEGTTRTGYLDTIRALAKAMDLDVGLVAVPAKVERFPTGGADTPEVIAERRRVLNESLAGAPGRNRRRAA